MGSIVDIDVPGSVRVLEIVDQFQELGVNKDFSLPQLVLVGDQSSGKSSLLERLTSLNFPVASNIFTRHATQVVLHRTFHEEAVVRVSIKPGPTVNSSMEQNSLLRDFLRILEGDNFTAEAFKTTINEATAVMGLPGADADIDNLKKRFSNDVLKIELFGPQHHYLNVVHVPGLFYNSSAYQTEKDEAIIRRLIESYIINSRSIILAVLDTCNDLVNQEVFGMVRAADPSTIRTVGVITKRDAIQPGDELKILRIAQNSIERLNHGWFVIKNQSTKDISDGFLQRGYNTPILARSLVDQLHANERAYFEATPWNQLARDRVGIASLKKFLGVLLYNHIRSEIPALVQEICNHVQATRNEVDTIGPSRPFVEQRRFIPRLAAILEDCD